MSSAALAVNNLAVRLAAGTDRLAELVRKDQDLASEAVQLDKTITAGLSKQGGRDPATAEGGRKRLAAIATERAALQKTLAVEFPDYAALSNPLPLKAKEIQALLSSDEAMVLFALGDKESFVLALTRDAFDWKKLDGKAEIVDVPASDKGYAFEEKKNPIGQGNALEVDVPGQGKVNIGRKYL